MPSYDAIVIGLGGMGSAAAYHLARRGLHVLGLDQFTPCHDRGSSHGETRIIRKAYFEHPDYVPLLIRAYALWDEIAEASERRLFERCGLLLAGPPDGAVIPGLYRAAAAHGLPLETLDAAERTRRFPMFNFPADRYACVFEADAGYLHVETCQRAYQEAAERLGAHLRWQSRVLEWSADSAGARVKTDVGDFDAARLVVCGGAWSERLLQDLHLPLTVRRKVQFWFRTRDDRHEPAARSPVFGVETESGFFYGFPAISPGVIKVAHHTGGDAVADPRAVDRGVRPSDVEPVRGFLAEHLPGVSSEVARSSICLYTMTPDEHFILDVHPVHSTVAFAAGFSGHGFKFASLVGEVVADLAQAGRTNQPVGFLGLSRFMRP